MAAEQQSRRDYTTKGREMEIRENERVPQLTSHFEAISVQGKPADPNHAKATILFKDDDSSSHNQNIRSAVGVGKHRIGGEGENPDDDTYELAAQFESLADKVRDKRDTETEVEQKGSSQTGGKQGVSEHRESEQGKGKEGGVAASHLNQPSLEEIANYRATAQEKSNQAIMGARERYEKANKESLNQGAGDGKTEEAKQRGGIGSKESLKQGVGASKTEEAKQRGGVTNKESLNQGVGAAKAEESKQRRGTEEEELGHGQGQVQQTGLETVKGTLSSAVKTAKDYTAPIAEKAKDYTISAGQTTAHYIGEKAVAAKDVAMGSGKVAAEYAGKAAEDLKDKAVVAGWSTAHYSTDTAVEGTKAAARLVKGAAEYAGAIAGKPLSGAKNVAESTGESVKEYTARKKEAAARESMKKQGEKESMYEKTKETFGGGVKEMKERGERGEEKRVEEGGRGGGESGILGAIGETIYEIAQTTKEIVIGQEEGEEKNQGYEKEQHYQSTTTKEHRG